MKHVFHLVRADVRRFRWLLGLWLLMQIADTVLHGMRPALVGELPLAPAIGLLATLLFLARWLGFFTLVPLVVQTHALVGSDAFWMTRPIPWRDLLASKLVLLGAAFVGVPVVCECALMLIGRVPPAEMVPVSMQTALFQALWLFLAMALATVTRDVARFALAAGGVLVTTVVILNITIAISFRNLSDGPHLETVTARHAESAAAGVVLLVLLVAAAVVPIVLQYRTRFTVASVAAGVAGIALATAFMVVSPFPTKPLPIPDWARQESAVRLVAESSKAEFKPLSTVSPWSHSDEWLIGDARLRLAGMEEGWLANVALADGTVRFEDGATLATAGNGYSTDVAFDTIEDSQLRAATRQTLGVSQLWGSGQEGPVSGTVPAIVVGQADFKKHAGMSGTYHGRFMVHLDQLESLATLPLQAGAEFKQRGRRIVIDRVVSQTGSAVVRLREFTAASVFSGTATLPVTFYLRNRDRAEAVAGGAQNGGGISSGAAFMLIGGSFESGPGSGFYVNSQAIRFPPSYQADERVAGVSDDWLRHAELVLVQRRTAGSLTRTIEITGFEMSETHAVQGVPVTKGAR